ncbi:MAG: hypothetical protein L0I29_04945 [Hyphomicrobiales bacterium]|nr:hypothetical protein [Hyphomicrobiales bacterium]
MISAVKLPGKAAQKIFAGTVHGTRPRLACSIASATSAAMKEIRPSSYEVIIGSPPMQLSAWQILSGLAGVVKLYDNLNLYFGPTALQRWSASSILLKPFGSLGCAGSGEGWESTPRSPSTAPPHEICRAGLADGRRAILRRRDVGKEGRTLGSGAAGSGKAMAGEKKNVKRVKHLGKMLA